MSASGGSTTEERDELCLDNRESSRWFLQNEHEEASPFEESFRRQAKVMLCARRLLGIDQEEATAQRESPLYPLLKRAFDIAVAVTALLALFPFFLLVALAILVEDGGPIFFYQERVGRGNRRFRFYKFRSMVRDAEKRKAELAALNEAAGPIFKMRQDPRITRVGRVLRKYSIDELPQLINVLLGDLSLVGPRPHLPQEVELYTGSQHERLSVQGGLICLREVCGRSDLDFDHWIELDILYIRHRSLSADFRILLKAVPAVLRGEGAY